MLDPMSLTAFTQGRDLARWHVSKLYESFDSREAEPEPEEAGEQTVSPMPASRKHVLIGTIGKIISLVFPPRQQRR